MMKRKTIVIHIFLIIALGIILYANSLHGAFLWDDEFLVKDNLYIKNPAYLQKILSESIGMGAGRHGPCYRPLQMLTYMFDYSLWGLSVEGYHLTNIILHILVALVLYWFITILYCKPSLSFLTSILFVTHPVHTEAVAYISGRADMLASLFIFLCLICYIQQTMQRKPSVFMLLLLSTAAAVLSKEYSLIIPALLLLYSYIFKKKVIRKEFISILVVCLGFIVLRYFVITSIPSSVVHASTFFQRIPGFFVAVERYLKLLLLPSHLHMEYGNALFSINNPLAIAGGVILALLIIYAVRRAQDEQVVSFSIFWFLICLIPAANLYPINAFMAEHWLYLPSVGFFLVLSHIFLALLNKSKIIRHITVCVIVCIVCAYAYLTIRQNMRWNNPIKFYQRTLIYAPNSRRLYHNLGKEYLISGKYQEAIMAFKKEIELDPAYAPAYTMLATAYHMINDFQTAVSLNQRAITLDPHYADAYSNLGNAYIELHEIEKAIQAYKRAIEINPHSVQAVSFYNNLASACMAVGRVEEAITFYEKALEINQYDPLVNRNIKTLYEMLKPNAQVP